MNKNVNILDYFKQDKKYQEIIEAINGNVKNIQINNASTNASKMLIASKFLEKEETIVVVYPNIFYANRAYEDYIELIGADKISFFPVEEYISSELVSSSGAFRLERMKTLINVLNKKPQIIITNIEGYLHNVMSKERLEKTFLKIKKGDIVNKSALIDDLVTRGYKKTPITEVEGTFSVRGGIVDIYIVGNEKPVRIDFFDDEVDVIKVFDVDTQLSCGLVQEISIYPIYELQYEKTELNIIKERILENNHLNDKIRKDFRLLEEYENLDQLYIYLPYIDPNYTTFIDILDNPIIVFNEFNEIVEKEKLNLLEMTTYFENKEFVGKNDFFNSINIVLPISNKNVFMMSFLGNIEELNIKEVYNLETTNNIDYNNNIKNLNERNRNK
jgi:transcription-repair coupling factor (superfamily II helicase)